MLLLNFYVIHISANVTRVFPDLLPEKLPEEKLPEKLPVTRVTRNFADVEQVIIS